MVAIATAGGFSRNFSAGKTKP
ncbi:hypothetical protein PMI24_01889, partial [Pseudomonas sp. GM25]